jgi:cytoskeletal protein RodZ
MNNDKQEEVKVEEKKVGDHLKAIREAQGLSLEEVSEKTFVKTKFLIAIEQNDWETMGAVGYTKAVLSTYARALKQDPNEIIKLFEEEFSKPVKNTPRFTKYRPVKSKKMLIPMNFFSILILIILIIVLAVVTMRLYKDGKLGSPFKNNEPATEKTIQPKINSKNGEKTTQNDETLHDTTDYVNELEFKGEDNPLNYKD